MPRPVVVFEVLSPSTRSEDLVRKRWGYQAIPTLAHLVYVDAARLRIEIATRAPDGRWWSLFLDQPVATLDLTSDEAHGLFWLSLVDEPAR